MQTCQGEYKWLQMGKGEEVDYLWGGYCVLIYRYLTGTLVRYQAYPEGGMYRLATDTERVVISSEAHEHLPLTYPTSSGAEI